MSLFQDYFLLEFETIWSDIFISVLEEPVASFQGVKLPTFKVNAAVPSEIPI
jgi:hypothetical protein